MMSAIRRSNARSKRIAGACGLALLLGLSASGAARAQGAAGGAMSAEERACLPDTQRYCKDAVPDHARVLRCLQQHAGRLRPACRQLLAENGKLTPHGDRPSSERRSHR